MEDVIVSSNGIILKPARVLPGASRDLKSAVTQLRQKLLKSWVFDQQLLSGVCVCVCLAQMSLINITRGMASMIW